MRKPVSSRVLDRGGSDEIAHRGDAIMQARGAGAADAGEGGGGELDAEQIGHQLGQAILGQQLIVLKIEHEGGDGRAILHRRVDAVGKGSATARPAALAHQVMGAMLGDDERAGRGQVKYLPGAVAAAHRRRHRRPAGGAGRGKMLDDAVGNGDLAQGLAVVAVLAPRRLIHGSRKLRVRGGFFSPSLDGGLPLLVLFRPSRRSNSSIRAFKAAISAACAATSAISSSRVSSRRFLSPLLGGSL
jgi:hypothetical protein